MVSVWAVTNKSLFSAVMVVWAPGVRASVGNPPETAAPVISSRAAGLADPIPTLPVTSAFPLTVNLLEGLVVPIPVLPLTMNPLDGEALTPA